MLLEINFGVLYGMASETTHSSTRPQHLLSALCRERLETDSYVVSTKFPRKFQVSLLATALGTFFFFYQKLHITCNQRRAERPLSGEGV